MSYIKIINLKKRTSKKTYTAFCNKAEKDGVFMACGIDMRMWIMDDLDVFGLLFAN